MKPESVSSPRVAQGDNRNTLFISFLTQKRPRLRDQRVSQATLLRRAVSPEIHALETTTQTRRKTIEAFAHPFHQREGNGI